MVLQFIRRRDCLLQGTCIFKNSEDSYLCFQQVLLHPVLTSFSSIGHHLRLCTVFHVTSSDIDELLSINRSADVFVILDSNVRHKDWELCYSFCIAIGFIRMVNFPTRIHDCDSHSLSICYAVVFPPVGNSNHAFSVTTEFPPNSKEDAPFHHSVYHYFLADSDSLCSHLSCSMGVYL